MRTDIHRKHISNYINMEQISLTEAALTNANYTNKRFAKQIGFNELIMPQRYISQNCRNLWN